jgi:hypothetical protein
MQREDEPVIDYDLWQWHTEGAFPKDQPPEQGYVHIGIFMAWLAGHDMLDPGWLRESGTGPVIAAMKERRETPCALRVPTAGRFGSDMLTAEGRGFAGAYYAPEYGNPRDWRRAFRRLADGYAVPGDWEAFDHIEPLIELRYEQWMAAGRPELMPLPRLLSILLRFVRPKGR